jgi:hypothetical protein
VSVVGGDRPCVLGVAGQEPGGGGGEPVRGGLGRPGTGAVDRAARGDIGSRPGTTPRSVAEISGLSATGSPRAHSRSLRWKPYSSGTICSATTAGTKPNGNGTAPSRAYWGSSRRADRSPSRPSLRAATSDLGSRSEGAASRARPVIPAAARRRPSACPRLAVLLADTSQPDALNASLTEAIKWADGLQDVGRLVATEYAAGRGPFQERARLIALAFAFLWDYAELVRCWATWAQQQDGAHPAARPDENVFLQALRGGPVLPPDPAHRRGKPDSG